MSLAWAVRDASNRLPHIRHRRRQAAVDRDRLTIHIGRLVAGEEQSHRRQFMRLAGALQGIELADLVLRAALLGAVEYRLGLHQADDAGLARAVRMPAGAGLQACDRSGADDGAKTLLDHVRYGIFDR